MTVDLQTFADKLAGPAPEKRLDQAALAAWIRRKVEHEKCVRFTLSHDTDKGLLVITEGAIAKKKADDLEKAIAEMVEEFDRTSQTNAEMQPRVQRFYVGACLTMDRLIAPIFQWPFLVTPTPESAAMFQHKAEEDPSLSVVVGHLQRLVDKCVGVMTASMQAEKTELREEKAKLLGHVEFLMTQRYQDRVQLEGALNERTTREITVKQKEFELETWRTVANGLLTYATAIGDKTIEGKFGAKIDRSGAALAPLRGFAGSVDPMKLLAFAVSLSPEEREKFMPLGDLLLQAMPPDKQAAVRALFAQQARAEGAPVALPAVDPKQNGAPS